LVGFRPDVDLGDVESDVGLTADMVIELTTSVKKTKPTWWL